ncbi:cobalamin synthesis protein cobW-like protein [Actinoplanes lutulentus]|uniref:Cobalamin synthesis protein cobW-like protein n=2 Tax=Actinoplanes lutulentus TaxID=1287878 RepID=A0A327Z093_9ACTN|nr:cobalamin synthesis protein cobW-like protein [Actinoplanes lutulentus]
MAGFWPHATEAAVRHLTGSAVLDLRSTGLTPGALITAVVKEVRRAPAPSLVTLLPERYEPDDLRQAWTEQNVPDSVRLGVVCTVVAADLVLDALSNDDLVSDVDPYAGTLDDRRIGDLVARQIEQAGRVLVSGRPEGDEPWEAEQLRTLLHRLAPWAEVRDIDDAIDSSSPSSPAPPQAPIAPAVRGLLGYAVGTHSPEPTNGVVSIVFRQKRPFHPQRLFASLEHITRRVLRSRGHLWLASRPDLVLSWESASMLRIEGAGGWLADLPDEAWPQVHPERRIAATLDWDPYYGDRHHHLTFIGVDLDAETLQQTLTASLLTDEELATGFDSWRELPDPFALNLS